MVQRILRAAAVLVITLPILAACGNTAAQPRSLVQNSLKAVAEARQQSKLGQAAGGSAQLAVQDIGRAADTLSAAAGGALGQDIIKRINPSNHQSSALRPKEAGAAKAASAVPIWRQVVQRYLEMRQRIQPSGGAPIAPQ